MTLLFLAALAGCDRPVTAQERSKSPTTRLAMKILDPLPRTDAQWKKLLTPEQYRVLRQSGTERAFTGEYTDKTEAGTYSCAACGQELFSSKTKFHSGCGWPAFYASLAGDKIKQRVDHSFGTIRNEVLCARCGSHLGHLFDDAPDQPTGQRFCINSVSLTFVPKAPATRPSSSP